MNSELTDRDVVVLEAIGGDTNPDNLETTVERLVETVFELEGRFKETERELAAAQQQRRTLFETVAGLEERLEDNSELVGRTTLEKYASMPPSDRESVLGTSEMRAVSIYEHWHELALYANGTTLLETQARANAKHNPSKVKYRLNKHFDAELTSNEVYRTMKAIARLSGGTEETDEYSRAHITGGDFEYHVLPKSDGSGTRRVLKEVTR